MPRWMMIVLLTMLVTFVMSSVYLRIKRVRSSSTHSFWQDGTAWRDLAKGDGVRVRVNANRLVADLVALPFALLVVLGAFFVYDSFAP